MARNKQKGHSGHSWRTKGGTNAYKARVMANAHRRRNPWVSMSDCLRMAWKAVRAGKEL